MPFTPVTGGRFLTAEGVDRGAAIAALGAALRQVCEGNELSSVHVNFCREDEVEALRERGYLLRMGLQYHWHNHDYASFDDYLGKLRSKRRNQVRRERRRVAEQGIATEVLHGDDIPDEIFGPMFACYCSTVDNHYYGRRYLNDRLQGFDLKRDDVGDQWLVAQTNESSQYINWQLAFNLEVLR